MIVGDGDIAKVLKESGIDTDGIIYFASGVSNSKCQGQNGEFNREISRLLKHDPKYHIVYFSSLALHYNDSTPYAKHKRRMESIINRVFKTYTIFRIGNITWGNNPNTIINHFKNQMANLQDLEIQEGNRYLLTQEELLAACKKIDINNRKTIILSGRMVKISDIVEEIIQGKL
ncbi:MAG: hypothetical protein V4547_17920 [Bacteroidota bacterium]